MKFLAEINVMPQKEILDPPVKWPCFYGIDFATRAELIASGLGVEEIRRSIGADSLGYVSIEGLVQATAVAESKLCTACFTGVYPITIPTDLSEGKMRLEITEVTKPVELIGTTEQISG